jgi:hypothetical protein
MGRRTRQRPDEQQSDGPPQAAPPQRQASSQGKGRWGGPAPQGQGLNPGHGKSAGLDQGPQTQQRWGNRGGAINPTPQRQPYWHCPLCSCCQNWASNPRCHTCNAARPNGHAPLNPGQRPAATLGQWFPQPAAPLQQQPQQAQGQQVNPQQGPQASSAQAQSTAGHLDPVDDEVATLKTSIKGRRDFIKTLKGLTTGGSPDPFYLRTLAEAEALVAQMSARIEELRPPETRLASCLGALQQRTGARNKLQAELAALDLQRGDLLQRVTDAALEVDKYQAQFDALKALPGANPAPGPDPMAALSLLLTSMGVGGAFSGVKTYLESLGLDIDMTAPGASGSGPAASAPTGSSPFGAPDPAAAAAAAATAQQNSCFSGAMDQAAVERARQLTEASDFAHAQAAGAYAQAAAITQAAQLAQAEAAAVATAAAERAACAAAAARAAASEAAWVPTGAGGASTAPPGADGATVPPAAGGRLGRGTRAGGADSPSSTRGSRSPHRGAGSHRGLGGERSPTPTPSR